jgi:hypothetical protein
VSTIVRRKRASRLSIGPYRRHELLTGRIRYAVSGYTGYGDGSSTAVADFVSDEMRNDWANHRAELLAFWRSGEYTTPDVFPDALPWLFVRGRPGSLPWAARFLDGLTVGRDMTMA